MIIACKNLCCMHCFSWKICSKLQKSKVQKCCLIWFLESDDSFDWFQRNCLNRSNLSHANVNDVSIGTNRQCLVTNVCFNPAVNRNRWSLLLLWASRIPVGNSFAVCLSDKILTGNYELRIEDPLCIVGQANKDLGLF